MLVGTIYLWDIHSHSGLTVSFLAFSVTLSYCHSFFSLSRCIDICRVLSLHPSILSRPQPLSFFALICMQSAFYLTPPPTLLIQPTFPTCSNPSDRSSLHLLCNTVCATLSLPLDTISVRCSAPCALVYPTMLWSSLCPSYNQLSNPDKRTSIVSAIGGPSLFKHCVTKPIAISVESDNDSTLSDSPAVVENFIRCMLCAKRLKFITNFKSHATHLPPQTFKLYSHASLSPALRPSTNPISAP